MESIGRGLTGPIIHIGECIFITKKFIKAKIRRGSKYKTIKSLKCVRYIYFFNFQKEK